MFFLRPDYLIAEIFMAVRLSTRKSSGMGKKGVERGIQGASWNSSLRVSQVQRQNATKAACLVYQCCSVPGLDSSVPLIPGKPSAY